VVVSRKNEVSCVITRTHQQAYVSERVEDLVISREAMESLKLVSDLDERQPRASVRVIKSTVMNLYYGAPSSAVGASGEEKRQDSSLWERESRLEYSRAQFESTTARERHRSRGPLRGKSTPTLASAVQSTPTLASEAPAGAESAEFVEYNEECTVQGGQVTLDILASHNVDNPECKVTLADIRRLRRRKWRSLS
jgi:hypothetical protein